MLIPRVVAQYNIIEPNSQYTAFVVGRPVSSSEIVHVMMMMMMMMMMMIH